MSTFEIFLKQAKYFVQAIDLNPNSLAQNDH